MKTMISAVLIEYIIENKIPVFVYAKSSLGHD